MNEGPPPGPRGKELNQARSEALYSLVSGEGDGFMLGIAAGDAAGGAWELGYSAVTEQATVISYHLIERRGLDIEVLVSSLRELDGSEDGEPVYRSESPHFRAWLDRAAAGAPVAEEDPSLDSVVRVAPIGVAFRKDPTQVVSQAIALSRLFDRDPRSVAAAVVSAGAVAASCFGQAGKDLISGVYESLLGVLPGLAATEAEAASLHGLGDVFDAMMSAEPPHEGLQALAMVGGDISDPLQLMLAGLALVAPVTERHHGPVEQAARIGGSTLGAAVGAIIGARVGIRAWPWAFANDTWFAEIGRRVVRGPDEIRDLPIPYAVEQHLMSGSLPGFH